MERRSRTWKRVAPLPQQIADTGRDERSVKRLDTRTAREPDFAIDRVECAPAALDDVSRVYRLTEFREGNRALRLRRVKGTP